MNLLIIRLKMIKMVVNVFKVIYHRINLVSPVKR